MTTHFRRAFLPAVIALLGLGALAMSACSSESGESETRAVLNGILALDRAGLHGMDESINVDGEIPATARDILVQLQTVTELTPWPDEFLSSASDLRETFGAAAAQLSAENPDITAAGAAISAAHDEEHAFSHDVWTWLHAEAGIDPPEAAPAEAVATVGDLSIYAPSVRFTLGETASGYFTVRNAGPEDRLLSASADIDGATVELHENITEGATARMEVVEGGIVVPAEGELAFEPAARYHVMIMDLEPPMEAGDEVTLTLSFEHAGDVSFTVDAEQISATGGNGDGHNHG